MFERDEFDMTTVTRDELKAMLDRGESVTLVEVLAERAYRQWHLPGAVNLPLLAVRHWAEERLLDKSAIIVLYCLRDVCTASKRAAPLLREMGYADVREYPGGKEDWRAAGYPIEGESVLMMR